MRIKDFFRTATLFCAVTSLFLGLATAPALAKTHHKHHARTHHHATTHKTHKKAGHHKAKHTTSRNDAMLRTAQIHLKNLGYYTGHDDGLMGSQTKVALKNFQRDHGLPVTGMLTTPTYDSIVHADNSVPFASAAPPVATNGITDQHYPQPITEESPQLIASRFAKLEAHLDGQKHYVVTLNNRPLFTAENQPAVIGISRTFDLGNEEALILTAYHDNNSTCFYKHTLLTLTAEGYRLREIDNCTQGYQATVTNGSLFVTFPENDADRPVGSVWRYEKGGLERL